jgi:hypothetical protein
MFTHKTYRLFIVVTALFFTLSLNATDITIQVIPREEDNELTPELPIDILGYLGPFLEKDKHFVLARWHKNPKEREVILGASDNERRIKFYKEIQAYQEDKKNKKKLCFRDSVFVLCVIVFSSLIIIQIMLFKSKTRGSH